MSLWIISFASRERNFLTLQPINNKAFPEMQPILFSKSTVWFLFFHDCQVVMWFFFSPTPGSNALKSHSRWGGSRESAREADGFVKLVFHFEDLHWGRREDLLAKNNTRSGKIVWRNKWRRDKGEATSRRKKTRLRKEDPDAAGKSNSVRYMAMPPRDNYLKVESFVTSKRLRSDKKRNRVM